jgi:hypothetical protein
MTSSTADERNSRTIHTAACLIIGDEVLGGKVSFREKLGADLESCLLTCGWFRLWMCVRTSSRRDGKGVLTEHADEFRIYGQVLFRIGNGISCKRAHWYKTDG